MINFQFHFHSAMFIFKIRKTLRPVGVYVCGGRRGDGLGSGSGYHVQTALHCLCIIISLPAYLSVCLSAYQSVWLSVSQSNWSTASWEKHRSCDRSAGIQDVWRAVLRDTSLNKEYICRIKTESLQPWCEAALELHAHLSMLIIRCWFITSIIS